VSGDEPRDDTSPDSSDQADPSRPEEPAQVDQPDSREQGEATPYAGYGSAGVHPIPPTTPPTTPVGPANQVPPLADAPGVPHPGAHHGPAYPGETYPVYPPGQPVYPGHPAFPPGQTPYLPGQPVYPGAVAPTARPGQVTAAVVMSWVGGGVFALLGVLLLALADNKDLLDGVEQQLGNQLNRDQATTIFRTLGVGLGIWGIAVIVFAALAWSGKNWARIALTVMGGLYCASQVVGIVSGAVAGLPFLAYVVICVGLLWTREAGTWFAARPYDVGGGPNRPPPIVW
jgi:hypothetical protein